MNPLKKILSLSVGLVVLATVLVVINTGTGSAQSVRLNSVVAAPTVPAIPVNVVNAPTVNANINGTPNVNVTNSSFTIGNGVGNPVPVRGVDDPANNPFFAERCYSETGEIGCLHGEGYDTLTVPSTTDSGQPVEALVVEFVSGTCNSVPGGELLSPSLSVRPPSGAGPYPAVFVPYVTYSDSGSIWYAFSGQTRIYAGPGSVMQVRTSYRTAFSATAPPPFHCSMTINGHYVTQ